MSERAIITGLGQAAPVRRSGRSAAELAAASIRAAIADAGIGGAEIAAVVTESSVTPQLAPASEIMTALGLSRVHTSASSTPTGAGILHALGIACAIVESGRADHALTYFAVDWGSRAQGPAEYHHAMSAKAVVEEPAGFAGPPLYFAMAARRYAHVHGLSEHALEEMLAAVAIGARTNALLHPDAQLRKPLDSAGYLGSPVIAAPLRRDDCCLLSDGAVAIVVSRAGADRSERDTGVVVPGWSWASERTDDASFYAQSSLPELPAATAAMQDAISQAGMSRADIDLVELYDCFSIATVLQLEALGFAKSGNAAEFTEGDSLFSTGAHPTNTHGGLLAHGYLLGANHLAEAIVQLRGEAGDRQVPGAEVAMIGAGPGRQYTALLMERVASP